MEDHPTPEDLRAFAEGELPKSRAHEVLTHFLRGCETCRGEAAGLLNLIRIRRGPRLTTPEQLHAYDEAFDRVFAVLGAGTAGKLQALAGVPADLQGPQLVEALLQQVWSLRHTRSPEMVRIGRLAVLAADGLDSRTYGERPLADLRCRAWAELGNAYRIMEAFGRSEEALSHAAGLLAHGTGDPLLEARVCDFEASLDSARGRFDRALRRLEDVFAIHRGRGDRHLAGRALLSMAICTGHAGRPWQALRLAEESLRLLDAAADPGLHAIALYNLLCFLVECRRPGQAREVLEAHRPRLIENGIPPLQLRWIAARIEAALGDPAGALRKLEAIQRAFKAANQHYKAANVSLDLAALHLRLAGWDHAYALVRDAAHTFEELGAGNRARAALNFLRNAFAETVATAQLVVRLSDLLRRVEKEPARRMELV